MRSHGALLFAAALCALTASAAEPNANKLEKLVVLDIQPADDSVKGPARALSEQVVTDVAATHRYEVVGQSDVTAMIGFEAQKKLIGCGEQEGSCLAELGGALGARYLLVGTLGKLGNVLRLDLKLIDTTKSMVLRRQGASVASADELAPAAQRAVALLIGVEGSAPGSRFAMPSYVLGGAGVLALGAGAVLNVVALGFNSAKQDMTFSEATAARQTAQTELWAGGGLMIGGAVALAAGAGLFAYGYMVPAQVSVAPLSGGAAFAVAGTF